MKPFPPPPLPGRITTLAPSTGSGVNNLPPFPKYAQQVAPTASDARVRGIAPAAGTTNRNMEPGDKGPSSGVGSATFPASSGQPGRARVKGQAPGAGTPSGNVGMAPLPSYAQPVGAIAAQNGRIKGPPGSTPGQGALQGMQTFPAFPPPSSLPGRVTPMQPSQSSGTAGKFPDTLSPQTPIATGNVAGEPTASPGGSRPTGQASMTKRPRNKASVK